MADFSCGDNPTIGKYVVIEKGCQIGSNVTIDDFVLLKSGTIIGDNCTIHAGAKIGIPAFNLIKENGIQKRSLHQKGVTVLEQHVDVGYNTVIQRGVEHDTVIGENTFVNTLSNIGHDVQIGNNCTIGHMVSMSGYVEIGANTYVSPAVTILNRVKIGKNAMVGIGSLVLHDVGDSMTVTGRPAVSLDIYKAERKTLKKMLNMNVKTRPIATRKGLWKRRLKGLLHMSIHYLNLS